MPTKVKDGEPVSDPAPQLPFEEALKRLEAIVEAMEHDDIPLESLLAKYEEGTKLAHACQARLQEAEAKIQQLEKSTSGQFVLKPLASAPEPA